MLDIQKILIDGTIYAVVGSVYLAVLLLIDNRMFLNKGDYPDDVLAAVPPRTEEETRKAFLLSLPFIAWSFGYPFYSTLTYARQAAGSVLFGELFLHAFLIFFAFWLVDLILLDGIIFCWITPSFVVIPGTEGFAGYKDFGMHLRGHFGKGLIILAGSGALVAGAVWLLV